MRTTRIALLRGVMPSGKNAVKIAALRAAARDCRCWKKPLA